MKPLPKIVRIIEVQPFQLTLLWNTSEIRLLDFAPLFERWETEGDAKMAALQNWEDFKQVALFENRTLHWPNVPVSYSFKGETRSAPLELDALELYRQSTLIKKTTAVQVGTMLREARKQRVFRRRTLPSKAALPGTTFPGLKMINPTFSWRRYKRSWS